MDPKLHFTLAPLRNLEYEKHLTILFTRFDLTKITGCNSFSQKTRIFFKLEGISYHDSGSHPNPSYHCQDINPASVSPHAEVMAVTPYDGEAI